VEIGGAGTGARGALTIDAGALLAGQGDANSYAAMVNNGTVLATGGDLRVGAITGQGALQIGAGATLTLAGQVSAGESLAFTGANGTLALSAEIDAPAGPVSGFTVGDVIDVLGSPISLASYQSTGSSTGVLTLTYGGQVAATLSLLGNYANDVFLTAGDGALGTLILVAPNYSGGGGASGGTANPDQYVWVGAGGGVWNQAANWKDATTGASPPPVAPGHNNLVSIAASQTAFDVIAGPANAASLSITGDVALGGAFAIGALTVGQGGATPVVGTVDLLAGSGVTANSVAVADGALSLAGSATLLAVSGTLVLGGGIIGVGLPVASLLANAGAAVTAASLVMGGGSGDYVTTDTTGRIEIGGAGGSAAGAVTVDAGGTLSGNGQVNPFGAIIDNGLVTAQGGTLVLGSVTGSGTLGIGAGATLALESATAAPITFTGANATLALASELVAPTGTITGFTPGEAIDIQGDPITSLAYAAGTSVGTLTLYYDSTVVARLLLAGSYKGEHFLLTPDGGLGTDVLVTQNSGGGGGGGGQGNTDLLAWTTPGSGAWGRAGNWTDLTTGQPATAPPGSENLAQVTGLTGSSFQVVSGPAACAGVVFYANTVLTNAYSFGTLAVGDADTAGALSIATGASVAVSGAAAIANGTITLNGAGNTLSVAGTLSMGGGVQGVGAAASLLSAVNQASAARATRS
jgi:hypothetical protein